MADEQSGPRLARAEAGRVAALGLASLLLLAPALVRALVPAPQPPVAPSCAEGAHRDEASGRVVCGAAGGAPLSGRAAFLLGTPLDPNVATPGELELVPGVGPKLAARIVADREARGPFRALADLRRVRGVGPKLLATLARFVRISGRAPAEPSERSDSP